MRGASAALVVALVLAPAAGARAAVGDLPNLGLSATVGTLPAGGTVIVQPLGGAPVAAVELWFRAPSTGFGATPAPSLARLAAQTVAASKPVIGPALGPLVESLGGRLTISAYTDSVEISALVPSESADRVVRAMTTAYFAPVETSDGFQYALREVAQEAAVEAFNPETILRDAVFSQLFASGPQHFPPLASAGGVADLTETDARSFAPRAFRSPNAVLVVSGAVAPAIAASAAAGRTETATALQAAEDHAAPVMRTALGDPLQKSFVVAAGAYGWIGPRIADENEATALDFICDYLFRPDTGVVTRQVSQTQAEAFVVGQFITLHDPGVLFVAYAGKSVGGVKDAVDRGLALARKPLSAAVFAEARRAFEYHLLSALQTPTQMADNFGWYAVEGNLAYAPGAGGTAGAYFRAAEAMTPEFVAATADRYLSGIPAVVSLHTAKAAARQ